MIHPAGRFCVAAGGQRGTPRRAPVLGYALIAWLLLVVPASAAPRVRRLPPVGAAPRALAPAESARPLASAARGPATGGAVVPASHSQLMFRTATETDEGVPGAPVPLPAPPLPPGVPALDNAEEVPTRVRAALSPEPQSPWAVTLEAAIAECAANNRELRADFERIAQAQAEWRTTRLLPNPLVQITPSLQPFPGRPFTPTKTGGPPQYDYWVQYPLDWWLFHKRQNAIETARRGVPAAQAEFEEFSRQRILDTVAAFYDVLEAGALANLAGDNVHNLERVEAMTAQRVEIGGAGTVELDRIRLALFDARRLLTQQQLQSAQSKAMLWALLGRPGFDSRFDVVGSLEVRKPATPPSADELVGLAEQYRPDLQAFRRRASQAAAAITWQRSLGRPNLTASLGYTHQKQEAALGQPNADSYGGAIYASVPIFDRNQGNVNRAESEMRQFRLLADARRVQIRSELEQAVATFRLAHDQVTQQSPAQLAAARNVSEKIALAYQVGGRPLIEVLDSQRAYRETYRLFIAAQAAYWRALHRINLTVGARVLE